MSDKNKLVFKLSESVSHGEKAYIELTFRKMKARDLVAMDAVQGEMRKTFALFASMADVPIQVIEEMDGDDFIRMGAEVAPLMGKSAKAAVAGAATEATK